MAITGIGEAASADPVAALVTALNAAISSSLQKSSNLSDLVNASTARTSLGLGSAAVMSTAQIAADSALTDTYAAIRPGTPDLLVNMWDSPVGCYVSSPSPRTYFGGVTASGVVTACYVDHLTSGIRRYSVATVAADDHNICVVSAVPGYRTVVLWARHNADIYLHYKVSDTSGDLATLGSEKTLITSAGGTSYMQVYRMPSAPNTMWVLSRSYAASGLNNLYTWVIVQGTINTDGSITWGTVRTLISFAANDQGYVTSAYALVNGNPGIRFAVSVHPFIGTDKKIHYGLIDLTTGAVSSPGQSISANVSTGSGLPLSPSALDQAYDSSPGYAQVYRVRGDGGGANGDGGGGAIALATSSNGSTWTYRHLARFISSTPGLSITGTNAYCISTGDAAFDVSTLSFRMLVTPTSYTPAATQTLARRWTGGAGTSSSTTHRSWSLQLAPAGTLSFSWTPTGLLADSIAVSSSVAPSNTAVGYGVDFNPNSSGSYALTFYQTTDGATWTQVGTVRTSAATTLWPTGVWLTPLEVGTSAGGSIQGVVKSFTLYSAIGSSTALASPGFSDPNYWQDGDTAVAARLDPQGHTWTIAHSGASVSLDGWQNTSFGAAGATPDGIPSGFAYPVPAKGECILRTRESAGTYYIERLTRFSTADSWVTEVLFTSTRPTFRLEPIENGGPSEAMFTQSDSYTDYTHYTGDTYVL